MKKLHAHIENLVVFSLLLILLQSSSQQIIAQKAIQNGIAPVMKIKNLNKDSENPMRLDNLSIDIKIIGQIAVTTLDMTYYNSNIRLMEGEFSFPLGEGMSVSRFALDIDGKLREGVVVEKELGRKTFEAIVRRGVDPGLLEKTEGNNFRARVYPIPADGSRRIVIAFEQELEDNDNSDLYLLPLNICDKVKKFKVHAEVVKNQIGKLSEKNALENLSFNKWNDSYVADLEKDNYTPNQQIALSFPHLNDSAKVFISKKNDDSSYFYVNVRPKFFEKEKKIPQHITLFWDNSGSSEDRDFSKEFALLDNYIKRIGNLQVDLVHFNIHTQKKINFTIQNGNWDKLKSAIDTLNMDGGTNLSVINFNSYPCDEILLFTDGISNYGQHESRSSNHPVITVNSSIKANHSTLKKIALSNNGIYINLTKLTLDQATQLITKSDYHFISAKVESGNISDMVPSGAGQFNKSFTLAGIMKGINATLTLNFGFGNTIVYSKKIEIDAINALGTEIIGRIWAEKKIEELEMDEEKNSEKIISLSKEYGIVTQNTSLLVLETLSDYLRYRIVPPKEMQEEYFRLISSDQNVEDSIKKEKLEKIFKLSEDQTKWWNTNFPLPPKEDASKPKTGTTTQQVRFTAPVTVDEEVEEIELATADEMTDVVNEAPPEEITVYEESTEETHQAMEMSANYSAEQALPPPPASVQNNSIAENKVTHSTIQINTWDPQTPYLKVLEYANPGQEYRTYLRLKKEYGNTPSFYIDASDYFAKSGKTDTAVIILSNLAELRLEEPQLLRVLGNKLMEYHQINEAVYVFEKIIKLRGEEPQSYRDLGLAYTAGENYQKAIKTLYEVIEKKWDERFPDIELIVLNEINNIISAHPNLDYSFIDKRLIKKEPVDIRVILTWDTDNCDLDLWVTDPKEEKCFFKNSRTQYGGKISRDFTRGYGPEEFMIKKAINGEYLVQANYYGTASQKILAPVNLQLEFITNFGKPDEKKQIISLRLEERKDVVEVGKFYFKTEPK